MTFRHPADEIRSVVPHLAPSGIALIEFAQAISNSSEWRIGSGYWALKVKGHSTSFVHLQVSSRKRAIRFKLPGLEDEFTLFEELQLSSRSDSYTRFMFSDARQLAAAAFSIRRAYELLKRGRTRTRKSQTIQEKT